MTSEIRHALVSWLYIPTTFFSSEEGNIYRILSHLLCEVFKYGGSSWLVVLAHLGSRAWLTQFPEKVPVTPPIQA